MRLRKGLGTKKSVAPSAVDGVEVTTKVVTVREPDFQDQGEVHSLQATRTLTPTPLPFALLRSYGGSPDRSPNGSAIVVGDGDETKNSLDVQLESRRSLSKFCLQEGESDLDHRKSNASSAFPPFANDETPAPIVESSSDSKSTSSKDRVLIDEERLTTGVVNVGDEAEADMYPRSACPKLDARHSSLHTADQVRSKPIFVEERQDDDDEKIDLMSVIDVEAALPIVEDDFMVKKLPLPSAARIKSPTSMVFTLDGKYHDICV
jgi:hypothetical protein